MIYGKKWVLRMVLVMLLGAAGCGAADNGSGSADANALTGEDTYNSTDSRAQEQEDTSDSDDASDWSTKIADTGYEWETFTYDEGCSTLEEALAVKCNAIMNKDYYAYVRTASVEEVAYLADSNNETEQEYLSGYCSSLKYSMEEELEELFDVVSWELVQTVEMKEDDLFGYAGEMRPDAACKCTVTWTQRNGETWDMVYTVLSYRGEWFTEI